MLFLRANRLTNEDFAQMSTHLKANNTIKVLDVSSNPVVVGIVPTRMLI